MLNISIYFFFFACTLSLFRFACRRVFLSWRVLRFSRSWFTVIHLCLAALLSLPPSFPCTQLRLLCFRSFGLLAACALSDIQLTRTVSSTELASTYGQRAVKKKKRGTQSSRKQEQQETKVRGKRQVVFWKDTYETVRGFQSTGKRHEATGKKKRRLQEKKNTFRQRKENWIMNMYGREEVKTKTKKEDIDRFALEVRKRQGKKNAHVGTTNQTTRSRKSGMTFLLWLGKQKSGWVFFFFSYKANAHVRVHGSHLHVATSFCNQPPIALQTKEQQEKKQQITWWKRTPHTSAIPTRGLSRCLEQKLTFFFLSFIFKKKTQLSWRSRWRSNQQQEKKCTGIVLFPVVHQKTWHCLVRGGHR